MDRIAAAVENILPDATLRQLLEDNCGVGPMQRFLNTADARRGNPVDEEAWNELKLRDPLAAELDSM